MFLGVRRSFEIVKKLHYTRKEKMCLIKSTNMKKKNNIIDFFCICPKVPNNINIFFGNNLSIKKYVEHVFIVLFLEVPDFVVYHPKF